MLHKKVDHHVGLSLLMGVLVAAWFSAAVPALRTQAALPAAYEAITRASDVDRDGIADAYDAYQATPGPQAWR